MDSSELIQISPDELRTYMAEHAETGYLVIDVRQPVEYEHGHIPGSRLIPLMELEPRIYDLPPDRDLVFYCHSGGRSLAASTLALDAEATRGNVFNLMGGIMAWDGETLPGFPRVQVFDKTGSLEDLLKTAMELEKGAFRYYSILTDVFSSEPFAKTMKILSEAETAHARAVYRFLEKHGWAKLTFEQTFNALEGNILEGGQPLEDMAAFAQTSGPDRCLHVLELSLHIEYSAYDLYRNMAEQAKDAGTKDAFLSLAQSEKAHMRKIMNAIQDCPEI